MPQASPQGAKLIAIALALCIFSIALNIITDSHFTEKLMLHIFSVILSPYLDSNLLCLFITLQSLLQNHTVPIFLAHICSHTKIPGPLTEGNVHAIKFFYPLFSDAVESHNFLIQMLIL